jgi:hypothetical protein
MLKKTSAVTDAEAIPADKTTQIKETKKIFEQFFMTTLL